jgi:hypothetical protein
MKEESETLKLHVFFDESVLEVFANDRTVISTRIYPPTKRVFGVRFFAEQLTESPTEGTGETEDGSPEDEASDPASRDGHSGDSEMSGMGEPAEVDAVAVAELIEARAWDGLRGDMRIVGGS